MWPSPHRLWARPLSIIDPAGRRTHEAAIGGGGVPMQYLLLIYSDENPETKPTVEEFQASIAAHRALMDETERKGILLGVNPLKPSTTATTIRKTADGKPLITDGPFAETKEQLAGYYLLECKDLDE